VNRPALPPIVLVSSCNKLLSGHPSHTVGRKYVDAVRLAGALPLIAPPFSAAELPAVLAQVHGVLLTGSPSNVHPAHFNEAVHDTALPLDTERDSWTLPLVTLALERGLPLLAICRGAQEVNVALGGSLHQAVHRVAGLADHRGASADPEASVQACYAPAHPVEVVSGGLLSRVIAEPRFTVNSVHGQGVNALAAGLRVEARAPDGLVEAFSAPAAAGFVLALQWHPEWQAAANPQSKQILRAFGDAVRVYRDSARAHSPQPSEAVFQAMHP
jgi:putative glutamine amidotransferase